MDTRTFPTKGNLIANKQTLQLAHLGYELMDKKRNVLIAEILQIVDEVKSINAQIDAEFKDAYEALEAANIKLGVGTVMDMAEAVELEEGLDLHIRTVMDSALPVANFQSEPIGLAYSLYKTSPELDTAREKFSKIKELTVRMAVLENAAFRLSVAINKASKRANALQNITIPYYEELVKNISNALEEKEREEFTRLKVIKSRR